MIISEVMWTDTRDFAFQKVGTYYRLYDGATGMFISEHRSFAKMYEELRRLRNGGEKR